VAEQVAAVVVLDDGRRAVAAVVPIRLEEDA